MVIERIEYINDLGLYKIFSILKQKNGLYSMAISWRGEPTNFERNCTEERVKCVRNKILNHYSWCHILETES